MTHEIASMHHWLALAGLLFAAAITPGPNNLVVLRAAGHAGLRGAVPAIAGIVLGGLLLLGTMAWGAGTAFAAHPSLRRWIGMGGALYLAWLGISLCAGGLRAQRDTPASDIPLPSGMPALVGFQFLNPKGWLMVLTLLAAVPATGPRAYLPLAGLFVLVPVLCLSAWASLGALFAQALARPPVRRITDIIFGALLIACAGTLLFEF